MTMTTTRMASADDIADVKNVIAESIRALCKDHYTPEQLTSLLTQYPRREVYEKWLCERILVVAEQEGKIVGFAQYYPPDNSIEAVHVLPSHAKHGVGKMLLALIEEIASNQGTQQISLGSSLNAVGFYEKCGYVRKAGGTFKCNDGVELGIVNYEKKLGN